MHAINANCVVIRMRCCRLLSALCCLGVALGVSAQPPAGKRLAVLVGVKEYKHADLDPLRYCENDVVELGRVLKSLGYDVTLLTEREGAKDSARMPTRDNIERAIKSSLKNVGRDDVVLVALAGHGIQPDGAADSYFCPVDAKPAVVRPGEDKPAKVRYPETLISIGQLLKDLDDSGAGRRFLLVDACRVDPGVRGRGVADLLGYSGQTGVLLSCSKGQIAYELDDIKHGLFFDSIIRGLKGEAKDVNGVVTWDDLRKFVRTEVPAKLPEIKKKAGARQTPQAFGTDIGEPFVFAKVAARPIQEADNTLELDLGSNVKIVLVRVPKGKFVMGSPPDEAERGNDEESHSVEITRDFWLGRYEVTQEQYEAVTGRNPSWFSKSGGGRKVVADGETGLLPVENVTWADAQMFCDKLTERFRRRGYSFRLPSEAEWEYACRGGPETSSSPFHWKDGRAAALSAKQANFDGTSPYGQAEKAEYRKRPMPVGSFAPNRLRLYDMHGNVAEWCQDYYGAYSRLTVAVDPVQREKQGEARIVVRGGSWNNEGHACRAAARDWAKPDSRDDRRGFRIVLQIQPHP